MSCSACKGCGGCVSSGKGPDLKKMREQFGVRSFEDLKNEVLDRGVCSMCRGCVTFCSASTLEAISILKGEPDYLNKDNCLGCGICYAICPRTSTLERQLRERYRYKVPMGEYQAVYSLRTTDLQIQEVCTDGGFVTGFLKFLMDEKFVDSALISQREGLWSSQPMIAMSYKYLLKGAGSSFSVSSSLEDLNIYTTYIPSLLALKGLGAFPTRLALVGTPCQVKTLRKMQLLKIVPSNIVSFAVGLFCYENFQFTEAGRKAIESKIGVEISQIRKINVKDSFILTLEGGEVKKLDLDEIPELVRHECLPCLDFTNWAADVSVGGLGSREGYTTVLARTGQAKGFVDRAIQKGYFTADPEFDLQANTKKIEEFAQRKYNRGQKRLQELGLDPDLYQ